MVERWARAEEGEGRVPVCRLMRVHARTQLHWVVVARPAAPLMGRSVRDGRAPGSLPETHRFPGSTNDMSVAGCVLVLVCKLQAPVKSTPNVRRSDTLHMMAILAIL